MCMNCFALDRRRVLAGGIALALAGAAPARAQPVRAADTPDAALALLMEGNARYVANQPQQRDFTAQRAATSRSQAPFAAILGCADSRVAPELAFDRSPGDLFVVRVAGNFVTNEMLGSLEFGTAVLGARVIMVLGHTACGAVSATVEALQKGNRLPGHIAGLATALKPGIAPALKQGGDDLLARATVANVRYGVHRLEGATPILKERVARKELRVVGAIYDLATGKVSLV